MTVGRHFKMHGTIIIILDGTTNGNAMLLSCLTKQVCPFKVQEITIIIASRAITSLKMLQGRFCS